MKKRYVVAVLVALMTLTLTGCSMEAVPSFRAMMLGEPEIVDLDYDPLDYVTLGDYKGIEVDCTVSEDDLRDSLDSLLASGGKDVRSDATTVSEGDTINYDYSGKIDGKTFDGGTAEDQQLRVGSDKMIDGFEDALVGMKVGETKDANLKFPDDYSNSDVAGKEVVFTLTVNYIYKQATDELVKKYSDEYDTVEAYKKAQKETLQEQNEQYALSDAMQTAYKNATIKEIPDSLMTIMTTMMSKQLESQASQYGIDVDTLLSYYGQTADEIYKTYAEERLIIEAVAEAEGYRVTQEVFQEKLNEILTSYDTDESTYRSSFSSMYGSDVSFEDYFAYNMKYDYFYDLVNSTMNVKK